MEVCSLFCSCSLNLIVILANIQDTLSIAPQISWQNQPRQAIRDALAMARAGKAAALDVGRCITVTPPSKFLHTLFSELSIAASMREMEACRRIATFVLATPPSLGTPPLLPIFLYNVLHSLIASIDQQPPPEQTMNQELLVTVLSSVLTAALHLEWALRSICGEHRFVLGQASTSMARRFSRELRTRKHSPTSVGIVQRLSSSPSFLTNFPGVMGE